MLSYAYGGSALIISPLGVPGRTTVWFPNYLWRTVKADMIKAVSLFWIAYHYDCPDVLACFVRRERGWESADTPENPQNIRGNEHRLACQGC